MLIQPPPPSPQHTDLVLLISVHFVNPVEPVAFLEVYGATRMTMTIDFSTVISITLSVQDLEWKLGQSVFFFFLFNIALFLVVTETVALKWHDLSVKLNFLAVRNAYSSHLHTKKKKKTTTGTV